MNFMAIRHHQVMFLININPVRFSKKRSPYQVIGQVDCCSVCNPLLIEEHAPIVKIKEPTAPCQKSVMGKPLACVVTALKKWRIREFKAHYPNARFLGPDFLLSNELIERIASVLPLESLDNLREYIPWWVNWPEHGDSLWLTLEKLGAKTLQSEPRKPKVEKAESKKNQKV